MILGVASLGAVLQDISEDIREDTYLGSTMAVGFLLGGVLMYTAARKHYSVGWRIYLGAFLVFFGFVGASVEADSIVNLRADEPVFGFVLAGAFAVSGFLLASSGYWRNVQRARNSRRQSGTVVTQPSTTPEASAGAWEGEEVGAGTVTGKGAGEIRSQ
jgi:hypothetical protein